MILSVSHLKKAFVEDVVISDATFHLEDKEKACLVGLNGAGKTTLFRMITGELDPDAGEIHLRKDATIGILRQHSELSSELDVYHEVLSAKAHVFRMEADMRALEAEMAMADGAKLDALFKEHDALLNAFEKENGYQIESDVNGILKGLGFSEAEFHHEINTLSGGEKTRVALGKLLLLKPDLLLLDEPTNHLDIHAISWLENYLNDYPSAVFVISHDRYFLDRIVSKVVDLEQGQTRVYSGNYSTFTVKKEAYKEELRRAYEAQQKYIKHEQEVIARFRSYSQRWSYIKAKSREKLLGHLEILDKPTEEKSDMYLTLTPNVLSGNDVLKIENLGKSFGDRTLFSDASIEIHRGEHVTLIGDNGTGKSTLLKLITGAVPADSGHITLGTNVFIGYYDQEHQTLSPEKTAFMEILDEHPLFTNSRVRTILGAFLFTGDDVFKTVSQLSGGEKGRLSLAKLMLSDANFLLLDEPTNHLDMASKEILEQAVSSYEGTVLSVSHDRYYMNMVSTRIIELYRGRFIDYQGDYDYYLEKRDLFHERVDALFEENKPGEKKLSDSALAYQAKKQQDALLRKEKKRLEKVEAKIERIETEISETEAEMNNPDIASNAAELNRLQKRKEELDESLLPLYEEWEALSSK